MESIIEIKNISKKYKIAHMRGGYVALRDVLTAIVKKPFSYLKQKAKSAAGLVKKEDFWALKDVSLTVKKGEILGIIGRNGAGKSTLLKILSQITPPTEGEIIMHGSVGSLLEVGTGFHPELTGRENIFLNGAILGMGLKEIASKFDQIVEFAGIDKFLDTPVKYYSSGMYVRLAFSVAAHMEPDILLVDEVLAVGDADFQKKCLGKMEEVTKNDGRTIIFVSHNLSAIERLCNKCVLLEKGQIVKMSDNVKEVIDYYLHSGNTTEDNGTNLWTNSGKEFENRFFKPTKFYVADRDGSIHKTLCEKNEELWIHLEADISEIEPSLMLGYAIYDENNQPLYWSFDTDQRAEEWPKKNAGKIHLKSKINIEILNFGVYHVELLAALFNRQWLFSPQTNNPRIRIEINSIISESPYWLSKRPGILAPKIAWENVKE